MAKYDELGREIPDSRPMAMPAGMRVPESLAETMRRLIRVEMSRQAVESGQESFEEADDFDVDDGEALMATPYELLPVQEERGFREPELIPEATKAPSPPAEVKPEPAPASS